LNPRAQSGRRGAGSRPRAIQGQRDKLPQEAADLLYHLLVLLEQQNVRWRT